MSDPPWPSLAAPFPTEDVRWHAVDRDAQAERIRLAPHLDPHALRRRLDRAVGPAGWSMEIRPWGEDRLVAELTIQGVARAAIVRAVDAAGLSGGEALLDAGDAAHGAAWSAAASGFGMRLPVQVADDGWVDAARAGLEPLHAPATRPDGDAGRSADDADAGRPPSSSQPGPASRPADPSAATAPDTDAPSVGARSAGAPSAEASAADVAATDAEPAAAPKPEAHQVIDRLIDRLRDEGLGAEAARLVARYGGYGADVATSRELYAKLRALLLERAAPG